MAAKKKKRAKKPRKPAFTVRKATLKDLPILVHQRRRCGVTLGRENKESWIEPTKFTHDGHDRE
ncbi:MAG TPA: hypothetical protein VF944_00135 [Candidatus Bathyarchaeia archaeon]